MAERTVQVVVHRVYQYSLTLRIFNTAEPTYVNLDGAGAELTMVDPTSLRPYAHIRVGMYGRQAGRPAALLFVHEATTGAEVMKRVVQEGDRFEFKVTVTLQ